MASKTDLQREIKNLRKQMANLERKSHMTGTLNKCAFKDLITEDLEWLQRNAVPCLEREHIMMILRQVRAKYGEEMVSKPHFETNQ